MGAIGDAKSGLVTRLQTISGLRVYGQPPESINELPAVVLLTPDLEYGATFSGNTLRHQLRALLLLGHPASSTEGWDELDNYLSPTGTKSIRAAVEGDRTLNGKVDDAVVSGARRLGQLQFQHATYHGAEFVVDYLITGA